MHRLEPFFGTYPSALHSNSNASPEDRKRIDDRIVYQVTSYRRRAELNIEDIEDVMECPQKSLAWVWALGIVVLAAAAGLWLYYRRKRVKELVRIFKPAHELAYERLRGLIKEDLIGAGRIKEFYERISDILRHYIEHRFSLRAPERTTEEFLAELANAEVLPVSQKQRLGEFLRHCDLVKFAKHNPTTQQIQETFDLVKDFIEKTKSDERKVDVTR
jgi:hypothetical protein